MNLVNLPPWLQTTFTILGALSVVVPAVVRLSGLAETPLGKRIVTGGNDVLKALKGSP